MSLFQGALHVARLLPVRPFPQARQFKRDPGSGNRFHELGTTTGFVEHEARVKAGRDSQVMSGMVIPAVEVE
jgi:hypothetical protein